MQEGSVFYQIFKASPLANADGARNVDMIGLAPTFGDAERFVRENNLTEYVIQCCVAVRSTIQGSQPLPISGAGQLKGPKLNG